MHGFNTQNVRDGPTVSESPGGPPTRRRKVDAIRRGVCLREGEKIVIVSSINQGVSKHERSERKTWRNMRQQRNHEEEKQSNF